MGHKSTVSYVSRHLEEASKILRLKVSDMVVGFGAAMALHGLSDRFDDIDVDVESVTFQRYVSKFKLLDGLTGPRIAVTSKVDIHPGSIRQGTVIVSGIKVYSLPRLLEAYRAFQDHPDRMPEKRLADAEKIKRIEQAIRRPASASWRQIP